MPLPRLSTFDAMLDRACADVLGDTILYRAADALTFASVQAHVDYRDGQVPFGSGEVVAQDVKVSILMVDLTTKPGAAVRLQLPRIAARTFKPINVRRDESGTSWEFELVDVPAND